MKKILIIEDERPLLEMYRVRFLKAGYEVFSTENGKPGIEIALKENPDFILLDILMPKTDGYEVIKALKNNPRTKKIPILVFSNLSQPEEMKKAIELGADNYVVKADLTPSELLSKVEKMLKKDGKLKKESKKRILIVESDKKMARLYAQKLIKVGFEAVMTESAAANLETANSNNFNLIILIAPKPSPNTFETLKHLKENEQTKDLPILVISDSAEETEIAKALEMGAKEYFLRPKTESGRIIEEVKKIL